VSLLCCLLHACQSGKEQDDFLSSDTLYTSSPGISFNNSPYGAVVSALPQPPCDTCTRTDDQTNCRRTHTDDQINCRCAGADDQTSCRWIPLPRQVREGDEYITRGSGRGSRFEPGQKIFFSFTFFSTWQISLRGQLAGFILFAYLMPVLLQYNPQNET
jgi:hypothetical protein